MREAVIVSTARTPIGKAYRGAFNDTTAPTLAGHAIAAAVERAGIDGAGVGAGEVDHGEPPLGTAGAVPADYRRLDADGQCPQPHRGGE